MPIAASGVRRAVRAVLVVDDERWVHRLVRRTLAEVGFEVVGTTDGAEALAYLAENRAPALILLDLSMDGMDGFAFRRAQLADPRIADIPTVLISSDPCPPGLEWLRPIARCPKPFYPDDILGLVERLCWGAEGRVGAAGKSP